MRLFWKIFFSVLASFILVFTGYSYLVANRQLIEAENNIMEQNRALGKYITKEAEVGYLESRWPFENLKIITERNDFLFWWIIKEDGSIYLADKASFMGTNAFDYFPEMKNNREAETIILNRAKNFGIYKNTFEAGKIKWNFWLGFSLKAVSRMRQETILNNVFFISAAILLMGIILYFTVNHFTKPIKTLVAGTRVIAQGNLDNQVEINTNDELGDLAGAFNEMTAKLKTSYTILEQKVEERTEELEEAKKKLENVNLDLEGKVKTRTAELENLKNSLEKTVADRTAELNNKIAELEQMNKLMVGRELKMAELKIKIAELEGKTA